MSPELLKKNQLSSPANKEDGAKPSGYFKKIYKILAAVVLGGTLLSGALYLLLPRFVSSEQVQAKVVRAIEEEIEGAFVFDRAELRLFPSLRLRFYNIHLNAGGEFVRLSAPELDLYISTWHLLLKRFKTSKIRLNDATLKADRLFEGAVENIELHHLDFQMRSKRGAYSKQISFSAGFSDLKQALKGDLLVRMDHLNSSEWLPAAVEGSVEMAEIDFSSLEKHMKINLPVEKKHGRIGGKIYISKNKGEGWSRFSLQAHAADFGYALRDKGKLLESVPLDFDLDGELLWNPVTEELQVDTAKLRLPQGQLDISGDLSLGTGEIKEMRLSGTEIPLEEIPHYWVTLSEQLPVNLGFSGVSFWDVAFQGTRDHLTFHANIDLSEANLTYAKIFSKPKAVPLIVTLDSLLKQQKWFEADFSMRCQEALLKGTLRDYELRSGEGKLNIITNKFQLSDFQDLLLPFQNYDIKGELKFLANWSGEFGNWDDAGKVLNVTLENGEIARRGGEKIHNIHLVMDYGAMAFVAKEASFQIGDSPVSLFFSIYNFPANPAVDAKFEAKQLDPLDFLETWHDMSLVWLTTGASRIFENSKEWVRLIFPNDETVENALVELNLHKGSWTLKQARLDAYGGTAQASGQFGNHETGVHFSGKLETNRWQLEKLFVSEELGGPLAEGKLFLNMDLNVNIEPGHNLPIEVGGEGTFLLTEGRINTFDLKKKVGDIPQLSAVAQFSDGTTPFDDVRSRFQLTGGKIRTDKLLFVSPDFFVVAGGEATLEGQLNHRLEVYLSEEKSAVLLKDMLPADFYGRRLQFGPIPFLLTGNFENPDLLADPERLPVLLRDFADKKTHKVLRDILAEERDLDSEATA